MFGVLAAGRWSCSEYYVMWHSQVECLVMDFICSIVLLSLLWANMFCIDMSGIHLCGLCFKPSKVIKIYNGILYRYPYSTKLAIPQVCCRLYCYECTAWVTMPMATIEWYFFLHSLVLRMIMVLSYKPLILLHVQIQHAWLAVPDTDFWVSCSTDTDSRVTCKKSFL